MNSDLAQYQPVARLLNSIRHWDAMAGQPITLARAPGRLDVMGGIADYSGSLVCELPLDVAAAVAIAPRDDGQIICRSAQAHGDVAMPIDVLLKLPAADVRNHFDTNHQWALYPLGCILWLLQRGITSAGVTIALDSDVPLGGGVSSSAAIEVATMTSLCAMFDVDLSPLQLAAACQSVENHIVGAPCGVMDQVTSCMGEAHKMLRILCQPKNDLPAQVLGAVDVPHGYMFVGIHSGVRHEVSGDPYTDTRVAAFMGQRILESLGHAGCLATINAHQFRRTLAAQLPRVMTGRAFLDRYEHTNDTVTTVNPDKTYAVRNAAEHGVREHHRVTQFVALLNQPPTPRAMNRAGRLMLASHHSYGLRANLGHAMTDHLVKLAMQTSGIYGAKITGGGCGGTVALLACDDDASRDAIAQLRDTYERETGRKTTYFAASGPGAAAIGAQEIRL